MSLTKYLELESVPGNIKAVFFDFDGVFTDNSVYLTEGGEELVRCSRYDGYGIAALRLKGMVLSIISSEIVPLASIRAKKLNLDCYQPVQNKLQVAINLLKNKSLDLSNLCYLGNDINDLPLLQSCALPIIPSDAHLCLRDRGFFMTRLPGGHGCVRELADIILEALR